MKNIFIDCVFKKTVCNEKTFKVSKEYFDELRSYCKVKGENGCLNVFLSAINSSYANSIHRNGFFHLNPTTVDYIINEIDYFKKKKRWRVL